MFVLKMILLCLLTIVALLLLHWEMKRRKVFWYLRNFKTPKGLPLLGVGLDFIEPKNSLLNLVKYFKECGNNFYLYIGSHIILCVSEPKLVECILGSNKLITKSDDYKILNRWLGNGILTSTGNKWKSHRKIMMSSFHIKILEEFVEIFDKKSKKLVTKLSNEIGNDSFDIFKYITLYALDTVCETAMGTSMNAQDYPDCDYVKCIKRMCDMFYKRIHTFLRFDIFYYLSKTYKMELKDLIVIHEFSDRVIQERKKTLINQLNDFETSNEFGIKNKHVLLDTILKSTVNGVHLTDKEIRDEVEAIIFAGNTSGTSISFTLYLLSKHSDVQNKVYEEIKSLLGKNLDKPLTYDILHQMKYLEMVIKESLRLYPSVPIIVRKLSEDTPFEGEILPKGLDVAIVSYLAHRNAEVYPDPEKFDPERFHSDNLKNIHPYAFIAFSAGPRNCIGQKFAMLEMKSVISKVLSCFKLLSTKPEHNVWPMSKVGLESANGILIRLEKRKQML